MAYRREKIKSVLQRPKPPRFFRVDAVAEATTYKDCRSCGALVAEARDLVQSALVIALGRGHVQVSAAHAHLDAMKTLAAIGVLGFEPDGVLIASLFGDGGVEIFEAA